MTEKKNERTTEHNADTALALGKGLDVGTANLAAAVQNDEGGITVTVERNAFLDIPSDVYSKNMLTKLKVPYVVHNGKLVVIGEAAFELANVFGRETRRPMCDGLISPNEQEALPMMKMIISKLLGEPRVPGEACYFCVPAPSLDVDNNVVYHQGLFESLVNKMGYTAHAINEAHAVVFAELAENDFTGIGLSFGGGMANACITYKSIPQQGHAHQGARHRHPRPEEPRGRSGDDLLPQPHLVRAAEHQGALRVRPEHAELHDADRHRLRRWHVDGRWLHRGLPRGVREDRLPDPRRPHLPQRRGPDGRRQGLPRRGRDRRELAAEGGDLFASARRGTDVLRCRGAESLRTRVRA